MTCRFEYRTYYDQPSPEAQKMAEEHMVFDTLLRRMRPATLAERLIFEERLKRLEDMGQCSDWSDNSPSSREVAEEHSRQAEGMLIDTEAERT